MKWRYTILISGGLCCSVWGFIYRPFPMPGDDPALDLVLYHTPNFYGWIVRWYYAAPAVALIVGGLFLITIWRVWFENVGSNLTALKLLPPWPLSPDKDAGPGIVVGEVHHPVKPRRNQQSIMAHYPGAGTLHRSGHFRGRGFRQDLGLHAPVRPANLVLAGGQSPAPGGRPGAGSQRRLLP